MEKALTLKMASKTFLVGEYLALLQGPSIVINSKPEFKLRVTNISNGIEKTGISDQSPAGQFINKHPEQFEGKRLEFIDPHEGRGGFGASSAQFALCYALTDFKATFDDVLEKYLEVAWNNEGHAPSGADVLAQLFGSEITFVDRSTETLQTAAWPFENLQFALVRTGHKVATHVHLNTLRLREMEPMRLPVRMVWQGLTMQNQEMFLSGLKRFDDLLLKKGWVAEETLELKKRLSFVEDIVGLKGCGALGADVLFITYNKNSDAIDALQDLGLEIVATSEDLSNGFQKIEKEEQVNA